MGQSGTCFTPEQEKIIQDQINAEKERQEKALLEAEAMRRMFDIQSQQPGYRYT